MEPVKAIDEICSVNWRKRSQNGCGNQEKQLEHSEHNYTEFHGDNQENNIHTTEAHHNSDKHMKYLDFMRRTAESTVEEIKKTRETRGIAERYVALAECISKYRKTLEDFRKASDRYY